MQLAQTAAKGAAQQRQLDAAQREASALALKLADETQQRRAAQQMLETLQELHREGLGGGGGGTTIVFVPGD